MDGGKFDFGGHVCDPRARTLTRDGKIIQVQTQPFEVLLLLIERAERLVTRDEIRARVWPDTIVDYDQSINYAVRHIRAALGADARLIQTVPRRGYRFAGTIRPHREQWARSQRMVVAAAGMTTALAMTFTAGLLSRHTAAGVFIYEHLVHPSHCPYVRMLVPALRKTGTGVV